MSAFDVKKRFWQGLFTFHDGYKRYYITISLVLFILWSPMNTLLRPEFWIMSTEEYKLFSMLVSILLCIIMGFMLIIYLTIWRVFFPTYWIVGDVDAYKMGRLYWYSDGYFAKKARTIKQKYDFGDYTREEIRILVNQGRLLNILNPWASLTVLHLPLDTRMWREPTKVNVWEPSARRKILGPSGETEYVCDSTPLTTNTINTADAEEEVTSSVFRMVEIAQRASHADVELTKSLIDDSAIWIPEDAKQTVDRWRLEDEQRS